MFKAIVGMAAATALLSGQAQAACWKADEASAATIRDLQSMLMVAALRCQVSGHPMMDDYNAFVVANKTAIQGQNEKIKAHFIHTFGPAGGQRAYDAFATSLANSFGAAKSGGDECAAADALAREGAMMANSAEGLLILAERQGLMVDLPDGLCNTPVTVAAASLPASPHARTVPMPSAASQIAAGAASVAAAADAMIYEPVPGDESKAATPVGTVDPAAAFANAATPPTAAPVAAPPAYAPAYAQAADEAEAPQAAEASPPRYAPPAQAYASAPAYPAYQPAPGYQRSAPAYQQSAPAYQPEPSYAYAPPPPGYARAPAPAYAYPQGYAPPPRYAPPPPYGYAPDPRMGPPPY